MKKKLKIEIDKLKGEKGKLQEKNEDLEQLKQLLRDRGTSYPVIVAKGVKACDHYFELRGAGGRGETESHVTDRCSGLRVM